MIASQTCCIGNDGSHMRCQTRNQMILRDSQRGRWAPLVDYEPAWDESSGYERATEAPSRTINQVFACVVSVLPREAGMVTADPVAKVPRPRDAKEMARRMRQRSRRGPVRAVGLPPAHTHK